MQSLDEKEVLAVLGMEAGDLPRVGEILVLVERMPGCFVFVREDRPSEAVPIAMSAMLGIHNLPEAVRAHLTLRPGQEIVPVSIGIFGPGTIEYRPLSTAQHFPVHELPAGTRVTVGHTGGSEYIAFGHLRHFSANAVGLIPFEKALTEKYTS